jgi:ABC-type nitrate/sulfonate/bicarbonate transport system substrate-binding protein
VWFTTTAWSKAHPDLVRRISSIFRQSSQWANSHDSQSAPMLSTISKLPVTVIDGTTRSRFGETLNPKYLQPIIDIAVRYALLDKSFPAAELLDPNALIDTSA